MDIYEWCGFKQEKRKVVFGGYDLFTLSEKRMVWLYPKGLEKKIYNEDGSIWRVIEYTKELPELDEKFFFNYVEPKLDSFYISKHFKSTTNKPELEPDGIEVSICYGDVQYNDIKDKFNEAWQGAVKKLIDGTG